MFFPLRMWGDSTWAFLICTVMVVTTLQSAEQPALADDSVRFRWAFVAQVGRGDNGRLESITGDRVLRSGDQFKMMVELENDCFVYVIYQNAQDGMKLLFPYTLTQFGTDYVKAKKYYIPMGDAWFELDQHAGRETFYLVASTERLPDLEGYFAEYENADSVKRSDLIRSITEKIQLLSKQHRELAAPAERPVPIGGAVRGIEAKPADRDAEIGTLAQVMASNSGVVLRTFNIDHR